MQAASETYPTLAGASSPSSGALLPRPYPTSRRGWSVVVLLLLAYTVSLIDRQILSLLVEPVKADLGITDTELSFLVGTAFVLLYAAFGLFFGRLADRANRRNMIVLGMLLWCAATVACGFARNFGELFAARMMVGVGEATLTPAAYSLIADCFPEERRSRPVSVYTMGVWLGIGAAFLFGGVVVALTAGASTTLIPLVGEVASWHAAFIAVGLPGVLVALTMLAIKEPARQDVTRVDSGLRDLGRFFRRNTAPLFLLFVGFSMNALVHTCLLAWGPTLFIRVFGWTAAQVGTAFGLIAMTAGPAGVLAGGWWVSRNSRRDYADRVLSTFRNELLFMPPCILVIGLASAPWIVLVALAVTAFMIGVGFTLVPITVYEVAPNQYRAQIIALHLMVSTLLAFGPGLTLIAVAMDYLFHDPLEVGKSIALVLAGCPILGAAALSRVIRWHRSGALAFQ